jgi:hypothetical protein
MFCKMRCELRAGGTRMAEEPCLLHSRCKGRVEAAARRQPWQACRVSALIQRLQR